jgi:hypothetical protein
MIQPMLVESKEIQSAESQAAWREDVQYLWEQIGRMHPDPFRYTSEEAFEQLVQNLDAGIPDLTDAEIMVGVMEIVSALQDGHSALYPTVQETYPFTAYPLQFYLFSDGVYLVDADAAYEDMIGARLLQIGDVDVADVIERIGKLIPHDNDSGRRVQIPTLMVMSEVLLGTGIIENPDESAFLLELLDGEQVTVNPERVSAAEYRQILPTHWRLPNREEMFSLNRVEEGLWWTYLEDSQALYVQYNTVLTRASAALQAEIEEAIINLPVNRMILDLRYNYGGDINTARPFFTLLKEQELLQQPDSLIVLISRNTFSAAVVFSLWLEQDLTPVFIGEATGGRPLMFENARQVVLPNSKLKVQISTRARQDVEDGDTRSAIEPQVLVEWSSVDYFAARDPILEAALAYHP